jgi:thiosulfate/3-mercaptopyruvate sulfurtransferase
VSAPGSQLLVSADELAEHPEWRVFDCRHDLKNTEYGRQAYARGHIPGALFLHLDEDLSGTKTGSNGRHPLPEVAAFAARMSACGVDAGTQVVAYDNEGGIFASRLWWMLRWLGHDKVAVLDGGLAGWKRSKRALEETVPVVAPRNFVAQPRSLRWIRPRYWPALAAASALILDARSPGALPWRERNPRSGRRPHPGRGESFLFRQPRRCRLLFQAGRPSCAPSSMPPVLDGPASAVVQQCGSGVTACHNLLAMEVAGLSGSKLYPGSWSEWCADPARPVAP